MMPLAVTNADGDWHQGENFENLLEISHQMVQVKRTWTLPKEGYKIFLRNFSKVLVMCTSVIFTRVVKLVSHRMSRDVILAINNNEFVNCREQRKSEWSIHSDNDLRINAWSVFKIKTKFMDFFHSVSMLTLSSDVFCGYYRSPSTCTQYCCELIYTLECWL